VDELRTLMLAGGTSQYGISLDLLVLVLATTILVMIGSMLYPGWQPDLPAGCR
jgi:hypothetical protein